MSRHATDVLESLQECVVSLPLPTDHPADHVLNSGAVLFPGAFDQHGCPLVMFPLDEQVQLAQLSKAEVVDFINHFLCLHNKKQEKESLVSVVADLSHASLPTIRFIAETLLLLELHKKTVHSAYILQPQTKDAVKLLLKLLSPSKSHTASFKKVVLKETSALSNYIDRSQLTTELGGYFIYCHQSWVAFIKEIDAFDKEFLSVIQRLPKCISTLHAKSRLPLPTTFNELQCLCSTNETKFQQFRRELGLDELLRNCELIVEKLRYPEMQSCYQAMAGTALFTHTAFDMLQNHSRIAVALEKVERLWHQAFSKARLQLQVFQLREDALQITEQITTLHQEKLQTYKVEIAKDASRAAILVFEFEASIHTPAMALVRCAEDVIHTLAEILPFVEQTREHWVLDLERLKEKFCSAVNFIHQNLRTVSNYHHNYNKASSWYNLVLCESFLQDLLLGVDGESAPTRRQRSSGMIPAWRHKIYTFLKKNPPPDMEELIHLAQLSNVIPDDEVQLAGRQMSHRCMTLRKLLISSGPVSVSHLQLALQWQYELLRSNHVNHSSAVSATNSATKDVTKCEPVSGMLSAEGEPPSLRSFDSGYDGAGSSQLEAWKGRIGLEGLSTPTVTTDPVRRILSQPQIYKENICNVSDFEDHREDFDTDSVRNSSRASVQIIPKISMEALNFEIRVKRSAALQSNPWLGLPVDDLDNSYTVTITQNPALQKTDVRFHHTSDSCTTSNHSNWSGDQLTQTEVLNSTWSRPPQSKDWMPHSQSTLEDTEPSPIGNILSSTIIDGRDKSICITEGIPTLLWDSYDLHDQKQDSVDSSIDVSAEDWDVKEHGDLKEVEKILDRADEILEKEEKVLAQEAELDALLSEDQQIPWMWDIEMSSSELAEAGVLGLEDNLSPAESDSPSEPGSTATESDTNASDNDGQCTEAAAGTDTVTSLSRLDVLTELREVHILDELIMEENQKIHMLRYNKGEPNERLSGTKPSDTNRQSSTSKDREIFRLQLDKEKREVDKLERSLREECIVKKHKDSTRNVVKCFEMEKARTENKEDRVLCDEVLSGSCNTSLTTNSVSSIDNISQAQDKPEHIIAVLGPVVTEAALPQDLIPFSHCQDNCEAELSIFNRSALISSSDLKGPPEEVEIESQVLKELDRSNANATMWKPVASLTPETRPDDGAFDPGGKGHCCPLPKPGKALLPLNNKPIEQETLQSTEQQISDLSSVTQDPSIVQLHVQSKALPETVSSATSHNLVLTANVKEHSSNNNKHAPVHHLSEETESEKDTSDVPPCLLQTDLPPAEETLTESLVDDSPHQQFAPQQPLRFDPSGTDEQNEDFPEECSGAMRITGCGSSGIEAQLNINMSVPTDFKTPIVLDTGSGLMKAGFADQDLPNVIFPTIIGMPKYEEIMNGDIKRDIYIGHQAQHMRGVLTLKHPIKYGIIHNWDDMEKIWHHAFQQLCVDPEDHPVLLTEAAMNPTQNRQRMVEIMFECFSVPFTYVAMQAVLALYATGRITGVVFDSGDGVSHSVPVFEGYSLPHAVQRFPLAGVDVTMYLKTLLQEQGVSMCTTAEMEIVREMKEKCCFVALNYEAELSQGGTSSIEMHYTMPDGQIVTLSTQRFRAPEILFNPELIGRDHYGMHKSIFKSVLNSDIDIRRCLLGNIVLSGGNTLMTGLPERLQAEIRGLVPTDMGESVRVTSPEDRDFSVWSGGAVLASQPTFMSAWISHAEYEEYGSQIVLRKCF